MFRHGNEGDIYSDKDKEKLAQDFLEFLEERLQGFYYRVSYEPGRVMVYFSLTVFLAQEPEEVLRRLKHPSVEIIEHFSEPGLQNINKLVIKGTYRL